MNYMAESPLGDDEKMAILVAELNEALPAIEASFDRATRQPVCKGFAIGRTIFGAPARAWMRGEIDDETAIARMAATYAGLISAWERARARSGIGPSSTRPAPHAVVSE